MYKLILLFILTFIIDQLHCVASSQADDELDSVHYKNSKIANKKPTINGEDNDIFNNQENNILPHAVESAALIIINKMTAKSHLIKLKVKEKQIFENLEIEVQKCLHNIRKFYIDDKVYLEIAEQKIYDDKQKIFSGWLYSKSPSLNTLEHPVYEVLLSKCQ